MILLKNRLLPDYFYVEEFWTDHGNSMGEEDQGIASKKVSTIPLCPKKQSERSESPKAVLPY